MEFFVAVKTKKGYLWRAKFKGRKRMLKQSLFIGCLLLVCCSCGSGHKEKIDSASTETTSADTLQTDTLFFSSLKQKSELETYMDSLGLVNVAELDSTIAVHLMYAQTDNFIGEVLYEGLTGIYLHPNAAKALIKAQRYLKDLHPSYSLIVYDAARPMSVQRKMWDVVKGSSKSKYVSNPNRGGGLHNYGLAVDVGVLDSLHIPLPMGTEVDHLGIEAHITQERELVRAGKITEAERCNRMLLRSVMKEAGFRALPSEWWHFNLCSREEARQNYQVIP